MSFERFHTANTRGHRWTGQVDVTTAPFRVIARPNIYRRQLHFEHPDSHKPNSTQYPSGSRSPAEGNPPAAPSHRKRKGGTVTPFGLRSGDKVKAEKAGKTYTGWIGGYTHSGKTKNVSVYDINWKRIGQFSLTKVKLLQRRTGLLVSA